MLIVNTVIVKPGIEVTVKYENGVLIDSLISEADMTPQIVISKVA